MRKLLKCRVAIVIAAGWLVLSIVGYLGKDSIYKNYSIDVAKTPYFVLVLQGIHDHIYPWDPGLLASFQKPQDQIPETVLAQTLQEESETTETIATTEEKEAEESETAETITTEEEKETEESETTEAPKNPEKKETVVKKKQQKKPHRKKPHQKKLSRNRSIRLRRSRNRILTTRCLSEIPGR